MLWLEFISAALILAKVFGIISWMWLLVLAPLLPFYYPGHNYNGCSRLFPNRYHDENQPQPKQQYNGTLSPFRRKWRRLFNTVTGGIVNIHFPTHDSMQITDIAAALVRYAASVDRSLSSTARSAQRICMRPGSLFANWEALLHGCAEAYIGDVISPLKHI